MGLYYGGLLLLYSAESIHQSEIIEAGEKIGNASSNTILGVLVAVLFSSIFFLVKYFFAQEEKRNKEFKEVLEDAKNEIKRLQEDYKKLELNHQETLKEHSKQIQKINKDHSEKFEKLFSDYRDIIAGFNDSLKDLIDIVQKQNKNSDGKNN